MNFSEALEAMKSGAIITREGWNGPGQHVGLHTPHEHDKMDCPFLYIRNVQGECIPWLASQGDLLAEDWGPPA